MVNLTLDQWSLDDPSACANASSFAKPKNKMHPVATRTRSRTSGGSVLANAPSSGTTNLHFKRTVKRSVVAAAALRDSGGTSAKPASGTSTDCGDEDEDYFNDVPVPRVILIPPRPGERCIFLLMLHCAVVPCPVC